MIVNFEHKCSQTSYKTVQFYISPSKGHQDVEVCVLPVARDQADRYTVDDIRSQGHCTKQVDANGQYVLSFELDPAEYVALIHASSDYTFVNIPALSALLKTNHYEFQFSMHSCDLVAKFVSSDSYSITIDVSYVWAPPFDPRITVYYTDNLALQLRDLNKFSQRQFTGMQSLAQHQFVIPRLNPYTKYQFYVIIDSPTGDPNVLPLMSGRFYGHTYATCGDSIWEEVGVGEESKVMCTIGFHGYY